MLMLIAQTESNVLLKTDVIGEPVHGQHGNLLKQKTIPGDDDSYSLPRGFYYLPSIILGVDRRSWHKQRENC